MSDGRVIVLWNFYFALLEPPAVDDWHGGCLTLQLDPCSVLSNDFFRAVGFGPYSSNEQADGFLLLSEASAFGAVEIFIRVGVTLCYSGLFA